METNKTLTASAATTGVGSVKSHSDSSHYFWNNQNYAFIALIIVLSIILLVGMAVHLRSLYDEKNKSNK